MAKLEALFRQAVAANLRYYTELGEATTQYLRSLSRMVAGGDLTEGTVSGGSGRQIDGQQSATTPPTAPVPAAPAMILEAAAGEKAEGVLLVDNTLSRAVSASVAASPLRSEAGDEKTTPIETEDGLIELEPGEKARVRIHTIIDDDMPLGVPYRGEVSIPGLSESTVPIIARRRETLAPQDDA